MYVVIGDLCGDGQFLRLLVVDGDKMSWIRRDKLTKGRILKDLKKLDKYQLYALLHKAMWDCHDCGKGCDAPAILYYIDDLLTEYSYYDSIREE